DPRLTGDGCLPRMYRAPTSQSAPARSVDTSPTKKIEMSTSHIHSDFSPTTVTVVSTPEISQEVREAAERLGVGQYLEQVVAFTVEIFGSFSNVEVVPDPEVPDWEHIIFNVPVKGEVEDVLDQSTRWSRRLHTTIPRAPRVFSFL